MAPSHPARGPPDPQAGRAVVPRPPPRSSLPPRAPGGSGLAPRHRAGPSRQVRRHGRARGTGTTLWAGQVAGAPPGPRRELSRERENKTGSSEAPTACVGKGTGPLQMVWGHGAPVHLRAAPSDSHPRCPTHRVLPAVLPRFLSRTATVPAFVRACPTGRCSLRKPPDPGPRAGPLSAGSRAPGPGMQAPRSRAPPPPQPSSSSREPSSPPKRPARTCADSPSVETEANAEPHVSRFQKGNCPRGPAAQGCSCEGRPCSGVSSDAGRSQAPPGSQPKSCTGSPAAFLLMLLEPDLWAVCTEPRFQIAKGGRVCVPCTHGAG